MGYADAMFSTMKFRLKKLFKLNLLKILLLALRLRFTLERIKNLEKEIFAEYKYTLNELLVKKMFFNTSKTYMTYESFTGSKTLTV